MTDEWFNGPWGIALWIFGWLLFSCTVGWLAGTLMAGGELTIPRRIRRRR